MRVGIGYDIHRLVPGRRLVLGGVAFESDLGLEGHSDADVLTHAIMDALLGAAALADIGEYFPPGDDRFRDASSLDLLATVRRRIRESGHRIVNIDAVVVAEWPRIRPRVQEMVRALAATLAIPEGSVGIKATTNEGVGPEGRSEAISAHVVALLESLD